MFSQRYRGNTGALPSPLRGGVGGGGPRALNFVDYVTMPLRQLFGGAVALRLLDAVHR